MPNTNITSPREPLIDPNTGLITNAWYRFFYNLFVLTGFGDNTVSLTDLQLGPSTSGLLEQIAATDNTIPAFRAYFSGAPTFASGGVTVNYDTTEYDTASEYNTATGVWTPSRAGVYYVSAGIRINSALTNATQATLVLRKNGATSWRELDFVIVPVNSIQRLAGSDAVNVRLGDTFTVYATWAGPSSTLFNSVAGSFFSASYQG